MPTNLSSNPDSEVIELVEGRTIDFPKFGRFQIGRRIGGGMHALVYEATWVGGTVHKLFSGKGPRAVLKIPRIEKLSNNDTNTIEFVNLQEENFNWEASVWLRWSELEEEHFADQRDPSAIALNPGFVLSVACESLSRESPSLKITDISVTNGVAKLPMSVPRVPCALQVYCQNCWNLEEELKVFWKQDKTLRNYGHLWKVMSAVSSALEKVHAYGLIHGDVRPANVLLTSKLAELVCDPEHPEAIFIDFETGGKSSGRPREALAGLDVAEFGSAADIEAKHGVGKEEPLSKDQITKLKAYLEALRANFKKLDKEPFGEDDRVLDVWSDIYMLGRFFLRMAMMCQDEKANGLKEGLDWKERSEAAKSQNFEVPDKPYVKQLLKAYSKDFYHFNIGIADLIARSVWQPAHAGRYTRVAQILRDIQLFQACKNPKRDRYNGVPNLAINSRKCTDELINSIIDFRAVGLASELFQYNHSSIAEFYGGHNEIVNLWSYIFGSLQDGDFYLAVSPRRFWDRESNGVDGRILAAQVLAAEAKVHIRRIHLINISDCPDEDETDIEKVVSSQAEYLMMLRDTGKADVELLAGSRGIDVSGRLSGKGSFFTGRLSYEDQQGDAIPNVREWLLSEDYMGPSGKGSSGGSSGRGNLCRRVYKSLIGVNGVDGHNKRVLSYYQIESRYVTGTRGKGNRIIGFRVRLLGTDSSVGVCTEGRKFVHAFNELVNLPECKSILDP